MQPPFGLVLTWIVFPLIFVDIVWVDKELFHGKTLICRIFLHSSVTSNVDVVEFADSYFTNLISPITVSSKSNILGKLSSLYSG